MRTTLLLVDRETFMLSIATIKSPACIPHCIAGEPGSTWLT
ncbi:unnamed protein product [Schistosoma mattheei]|uniref:Uncharacterized protein n=1 Tax=Schistosoma mattheei TaxID=31246 RepID=A0A183PEZ8_9TREM|nr:unnamed protein product [Schistosoma mattheei]